MDCVHFDSESSAPWKFGVYYEQLNREAELLHTAEQGDRVILVEAVSIGEQSLGNKHPGEKAMVDIFCIYYQYLHIYQRKALPSL